jgi:zinc transport system ATP-binding protein
MRIMADKREIVEIKGLHFSYDGVFVLDGVDLKVEENDFLGIIGPNGGGKTTLLKIMLGLLKPTAGEITVLGGAPEEARKSIGYVPQYSKFDETFPITVMDVVLLGLMGNKAPGRSFSRASKDKALAALERTGMEHLAGRAIGKLSVGQRQRVFIARAIAAEPLLLLLDEPTSSIDPTGQGDFYAILSELKSSMAIILVTHDMIAISKYVEKIGCLNRKLYYHGFGEICGEDLEKVYGCPVDLIAHGVPHRVMKEHGKE